MLLETKIDNSVHISYYQETIYAQCTYASIKFVWTFFRFEGVRSEKPQYSKPEGGGGGLEGIPEKSPSEPYMVIRGKNYYIIT